MRKLRMILSPQSHLADVMALMDSYAVELSDRNHIYGRMPLIYCEGTGILKFGASTLIEEFRATISPEFTSPDDLSLRLIQYSPPPRDNYDREKGEPAASTRWPFYVTAQLELELAYEKKWWKFVFTPEKLYTERTV